LIEGLLQYKEQPLFFTPKIAQLAPVKISASVYSKRDMPLADLVKMLEAHGVDMLHIDCRDQLSVFDDIAEIRSISDLPIDLHIISAHPEQYYTAIADLEVEYVSLQWENMLRMPELPTGTDTHFGLALSTQTDIAVLADAGRFDHVMLMCTTPGMSGGDFQRENFQRIIAVKHRYPQYKIQVDGGVNDEVGYVLRLLGVDSVVSGSFLMNQASLGAGMVRLFKTPIHSPYQVRDFMIPSSYLPILDVEGLTFVQVLRAIEDKKQGFVLLTDSQSRLKGVISNADVRRGILQQIDNLSNIDPTHMFNLRPVSISPDAGINDLLTMVRELPFIILFLPVVNDDGTLLGAVLLNYLTKF
jgi:ribulose-phosphate 3-epimerase